VEGRSADFDRALKVKNFGQVWRVRSVIRCLRIWILGIWVELEFDKRYQHDSSHSVQSVVDINYLKKD